MAEVIIKDIYKNFGALKVIEGISFTADEGNFISLLGPSGCGKTTLLRIVAGLECADAGSVIVDGVDITGVPVEQRNIGVVFQNYALIPHMTVFNNIAYGLKIRKKSREEIENKVQEYISLVGLEGMEHKKVTKLSGGQQQRVALARALIIEPKILLLDEPLSALDRKIRAEMQYEIRRIQQQVGITTLFVTHDQEEAMTMSDKILLMNQGKIEQMSTPEIMYNHPVSLYASDFLGKANVLKGQLLKEDNMFVVKGNDWRIPVSDTKGIEEGTQISIAIRGEHFKIHAQQIQGSVACEVKMINFTGAMCKLYLNLGEDNLEIACINLDALELSVGQTIYVTVDANLVHCFQ